MRIVRNLSISNFNKPWRKNHNIKNLIAAILFVMLTIFVLLALEMLLQNGGSVIVRKRAIEQRQANSVDIMIIGNSHAYCTFNPTVMEKIINKRILNVGLPDQKIDTTYYYLLELLEKQKPEIIIFEAYAFGRSNLNYQGYVANIDAMSPSFNKFKACFEIFPDKYDAFRMCIGIFRSHNNWKNVSLVKQNIKHLLGLSNKPDSSFRGFYELNTRMSEETIKKYEEANDLEFNAVIDAYSIDYFIRISKICKERNIRLIVTMAPFNTAYLNKVDYSSFHMKLDALCQEEGVEYIDFNMLYANIGLEYQDFEDSFQNAQHLNKWGAEKVSQYMADYLYHSVK